jgi:hypothetical protein
MPLPRRDELNRIAKAAFDAGEVESIEEALELFRSYRFGVVVGPELADDPLLQAALLTIANAGPRACLGGVTIAGATDVVLDLAWAHGQTVADAVTALGCTVAADLERHPVVIVGDGGDADGEPIIHLRASGWVGGVTPDPTLALAEATPFLPAGSLAGALAVSELFQHLRGNPLAAHRTVGLSLWRPELDWREDEAQGPALTYLPAEFWLLGLGHLGQAHAWTIGLLPYPDPGEAMLMLQDRDTIVSANEATSMLLDADALGQLKTRLAVRRLEALGFTTRVCERLFDAQQRLQAGEPMTALAGFDNAPARRPLSDAGFDLVVDVGLGGGPQSYLDIMLHSFPASRRSSEVELWKARPASAESLVERSAGYRRLVDESGDRCGVLEIAGISVATAFVGCAAAALSVSEVCRALADGPRYEVVDLSLRNPARVRVAELVDPTPFAGRYVAL